jgi:hypothetical protein
MAYTTPTPYFETATTPGSTHAAFKEIALWMNGVHPDQKNAAPWSVIDCYDGTTRVSPAGGSLNNLPTGHKYRPDETDPPEGSYIIYQAPDSGVVSARFQLYMEMSSLSRGTLGICMLNDWDVGAGTDANPDIPATALGVPGGAAGVDGLFNDHTDYLWRVIADEGTLWICAFPTVAGNPEVMTLGDLAPENNATLDPRPFIISTNPDTESWGGAAGALFKTISILDDTTVISVAREIDQNAAMTDIDDQDALTKRSISSVSAYTTTAAERYRKGTFRLAGAISRHVRGADQTERITAGTSATDYQFEVWGSKSPSGDRAHIVTRYPPGTALDSHVQISANSIPETLEG